MCVCVWGGTTAFKDGVALLWRGQLQFLTLALICGEQTPREATIIISIPVRSETDTFLLLCGGGREKEGARMYVTCEKCQGRFLLGVWHFVCVSVCGGGVDNRESPRRLIRCHLILPAPAGHTFQSLNPC